MKKILLLSAYHAQSHDYWAKQLMGNLSEFNWTLLSLPPRYFAWRIRGNPISFAARFSEELKGSYDLVIATSMTDLATIKALNPSLSQTPSLLYFHENQFAYPEQSGQKTAVEAQMVSLYSAMAADKLVFNSNYNQVTFLEGIDGLLGKMPDLVASDIISGLKNKSSVLGVPVSVDGVNPDIKRGEKLKLCWAARWEYDKGPDMLLEILRGLEVQNVDFEISVLGQGFRKVPDAFNQIKQEFDDRIKQWGYLESRQDYLNELASSHVFISTAEHEFFGISTAEASALGCNLLLPNKLVYPELYPKAYLYNTSDKAVDWLMQYKPEEKIQQFADSSHCLVTSYKQFIENLLQ